MFRLFRLNSLVIIATTAYVIYWLVRCSIVYVFLQCLQ